MVALSAPLMDNATSIAEPPATPASAEPRKRINLRTPDIMTAVQAQVESHYRSELVEKIRARGGIVSAGGLTVRLAKQFGFCYGVERAIDLAYAARKSKEFAGRRLFILGEIIHNPEVNAQIAALGIRNLIGPKREAEIGDLTSEDVVIVPAFGAEVATVEKIKALGCFIVDTTCGDVMSVWRRVRQYAADEVTSIIHGKAEHEETKATASQARSKAGRGHYLVVLTLEETDYVCEYIRHGGDRLAFLTKFGHAHSEGFDPDLHLRTVGVANQTTMLRGETEEVQRRIRQAIMDRDGAEAGANNFRFFDTICGATQERQDALREMMVLPMNLLLVVGGYNSSNTSHLAEMGAAQLPTYFIRDASRLENQQRITHFDLHQGREVVSENWLPAGDLVVGVTAGASCPNHLIEETIKRLFAFRGVDAASLV
jgi:4-hydroxy-3-methylbut-2-enyl diphosphate reductase